jgi:hypothetical protein
MIPNVDCVECHSALKVSSYGKRWVSSLIQLRFDIAWDLWIFEGKTTREVLWRDKQLLKGTVQVELLQS